jgi:hypothetical protein
MTKTQQCDIYKNLLSVIILPEEHSLKDTCMCIENYFCAE